MTNKKFKKLFLETNSYNLQEENIVLLVVWYQCLLLYWAQFTQVSKHNKIMLTK